MRATFGIAPEGRLPARMVAEHLGAAVLCPTQLPGFSKQQARVLLADESGFSAVTVVRDEKRLILHNTSHPPERQESNLFHEVSHLLCKHPAPAIPMVPGFSRPVYSKDEDEANWLGSCLHLPRAVLASCARQRLTADEVCEAYCASDKMLRWRLNMTRVKLVMKSA